jgi:predicted AAA+ superfamily ATPase
MKLSEIQEIAAGQKLALESQEYGLERLLLPELPDIQSHVLVVSGIRRCGKSTLLRQFVRKLDRPYFYLNFDDIRLAPKKVYIADTGIIKTSSVSFSNNLGALLENFVFNCLRTETGVSGSVNDREIFYFAGKNGGECDFVVSPHGKPSCIQVCWELTLDNQDREIQGLLEAMEFFNLDCGSIITFNTEDLIQTAGKTIKVNPAWK